ncbi:MAG TPA: acyl carrier protein [Acholeplasma sp.]|jgi:acyl carrier protein|nr:acyl carrier protein [Acholeplasma equifetale]HHY96808.1 acyl carrier protein [Acholeplasma sp.]
MQKDIIEIISEELNVDKTTINETTRLREDLNVDSLDVVELIMRIEETFDVTVSDEAATKMETVGDIIEYVKGLKS